MTIQSAIYLAGNKRALYERIKPYITGYDTLVDLFTGSATVALNAVSDGICKEVYANDSLKVLIDLHKQLQKHSFITRAEKCNKFYPKTLEGYIAMRDEYNSGNHTPELLLNLQYRSNSNYMRFNKSGEFNMTYGKRSCFNRERLEVHHKLCKDIKFTNLDFVDFIVKYVDILPKESTVFYVDSPYINTIAPYNEQGGWTKADNTRLSMSVLYLKLLGYKVVISNVFSNRGKINTEFQEWCEFNKEHFEVHHINHNYANSSFRKSNKVTDEVLLVSKN